MKRQKNNMSNREARQVLEQGAKLDWRIVARVGTPTTAIGVGCLFIVEHAGCLGLTEVTANKWWQRPVPCARCGALLAYRRDKRASRTAPWIDPGTYDLEALRAAHDAKSKPGAIGELTGAMNTATHLAKLDERLTRLEEFVARYDAKIRSQTTAHERLIEALRSALEELSQ